jgi:hypothetical protein
VSYLRENEPSLICFNERRGYQKDYCDTRLEIFLALYILCIDGEGGGELFFFFLSLFCVVKREFTSCVSLTSNGIVLHLCHLEKSEHGTFYHLFNKFL